MNDLPRSYEQFRKDHSEVWRAYETLGETAATGGPLDLKTRELIKLGMAAANGSISAVQSHVHRALQAGGSPDEIEHALLLGITTLGFPAMMAALTWAKEAIEAHQAKDS
jgi:4-carboxymuconolactone decarboxylase